MLASSSAEGSAAYISMWCNDLELSFPLPFPPDINLRFLIPIKPGTSMVEELEFLPGVVPKQTVCTLAIQLPHNTRPRSAFTSSEEWAFNIFNLRTPGVSLSPTVVT
jgi:hypothetical protein